MTNLILGADSKFGKILKNHLPGIYLTRQEFDLSNPNFDQFDALTIDNIICLIASNSKSFQQIGKNCDSIFKLLDTIKYNTAWIFTSGLGTFNGSKNNEHVYYSAEKMLLNFVSFKKNYKTCNIKIIHPGHMATVEEYSDMVNKFLQLMGKPPDKNLIWSLAKNSYIPY
jgi:hypothetical protein